MFQAARDVVKRMELKVGEFATAFRPMGNEKEPLDTGEQSEKTTIATVIPSDSGAKILKKMDTTVNNYEKINDIKACKEIIAKNKGTEKQVSNDVNINGSEAQKMATEAVMNALEKAGIPVKMVSAEEAANMMGEEGVELFTNFYTNKKNGTNASVQSPEGNTELTAQANKSSNSSAKIEENPDPPKNLEKLTDDKFLTTLHIQTYQTWR